MNKFEINWPADSGQQSEVGCTPHSEADFINERFGSSHGAFRARGGELSFVSEGEAAAIKAVVEAEIEAAKAAEEAAAKAAEEAVQAAEGAAALAAEEAAKAAI